MAGFEYEEMVMKVFLCVDRTKLVYFVLAVLVSLKIVVFLC